MTQPTLCVAIVTARDNQHTSYDRWRELRAAFLDRRGAFDDLPLWDNAGRCAQAPLVGEFGALLTACLNAPVKYSHIEYQLRALALQTRLPDDVLVISRYRWPDLLSEGPEGARWFPPMLGDREAADYPLSRLATALEVSRARPVSYGCADKNTALVLNRCDYVLFLDDCCLPSPGTVAAAYDVCATGNVLLLGHQKVSFDAAGLRVSTSNWDPEAFSTERNVFGIFAAPMELIIGVNGWNTQLDGGVADLDVELKYRMDCYLRMRERRYVVSRAARVYEIDHETPWAHGSPTAWRPAEGAGYPVCAPGVNLRELRTAALAEMAALDALVAQQEEDEDDAEEDPEE
jgi:hypothetical protein